MNCALHNADGNTMECWCSTGTNTLVFTQSMLVVKSARLFMTAEENCQMKGKRGKSFLLGCYFIWRLLFIHVCTQWEVAVMITEGQSKWVPLTIWL